MKSFLYWLCFLPALLIACSSVKTSRPYATAGPSAMPVAGVELVCNRTVKFYIEKGIVISESGEEKESNNAVELIVNPGDGQLTLTEVKNSESGKTPLKVESCSLSAGMLSGEAVYTMTNENQLENGNTVVTTMYVKLEAADGVVTISVNAPGKPGGLKAVASRWEVMD